MKAKTDRQMTPEQARLRLEGLCARAEHCTHEIREKLRGWKIAPSEADKIVDHLLKHKFIDDGRFAAAFINDKIKFARWGQRKVIQALVLKRIDRRTITRLVSEIDDETVGDNLLQLLEAKARTIPEAKTFEGRTKLYRYALSRGYCPDLVSKIIRKHFV